MDLNQFKDYLRQRENPIIFDKKGKFIYFPTNKVMQTTLARRILKKRCIVSDKKCTKTILNNVLCNNYGKNVLHEKCC